MNTNRVFLTHEPLRSSEHGLVPSFDLSGAMEHGKLEVLFPYRGLFAPDAYETMKEKLNDFDEDNDVIFPCGHPASMLLVGHALGELGIRAIKVLMYDKREKRNYPMRIDLW